MTDARILPRRPASADDPGSPRVGRTRTSVRIGCGAGFAGDRVVPSLDLVRAGDLDALVLECLAERTLALAQRRMKVENLPGYDPLLETRLRVLLPESVRRGVVIITNAGAADPVAAGHMAQRVAADLGVELTVAVVTGDDVLPVLDPGTPALDDGDPIRSRGALMSANAYLGAAPIMDVLAAGADLVITGRVADAALFLAPVLHGLGEDLTNRELVAAGLVAGHLLECGAQVSGGYFADGGHKSVPGLQHVGLPIADVDRDGEIVVTKLAGSGGVVSRATVTEQLLYEVLDPQRYLTPDGAVDLSQVLIDDVGPDRVAVRVARAAEDPPDTLKVSVGYEAGYFAEAEIAYLGSGCRDSAQLAVDVLRSRLDVPEPVAVEIHDGILDDHRGASVPCARVRVAAQVHSQLDAERVAREVSALYTNGPAGGSGVRTSVRPTVGIVSALIPADAVDPQVHLIERRAEVS